MRGTTNVLGMTALNCASVATIWYVIVIDVLRSVARTRRLISNVLNLLSEDDFYTSC